MPRLTLDQQLEKAQKELDEGTANFRKLAAKKARERRQNSRKRDNKRKILGGVLLFKLASQHASVSAKLKEYIDGLAPREKEAFDDWPIPAPPPKPSAPRAPSQPAASDQAPAPTPPAPAKAGAFGGFVLVDIPDAAPAPSGGASALSNKGNPT